MAAPFASICFALYPRLQLHVLIEQKSVTSLPGMRIDFSLQFLYEHSITLTGGAVPVIAKVMCSAGGIH
ncbi:hypothetical protein [Rossellomorea arthrocnemi]|uniref:hypothetical protein n=1 Tax=Rossellomorea arthrocnemi TaxID=2769542 RepID=UPI00191A4A51